ncbi:SRPBCC domain-containing protein [Chitinophaga sedimenti]|uniref:SRPBCC domain-containing protein n=1 Tax=Chitinophaga sedimenti TaxID=2033606 RepID=UPI0027E00EE1|nr:SRPBCC domain-containing protein [Chitinophaga sedimenti]
MVGACGLQEHGAPDGFSGRGLWEMTMHDPDGTEYAYKSVFREIIFCRKIVYEHFVPGFIATILFESLGNKTVIDWSMMIETAELKDFLIREHKADIGQQQNMDRLVSYVNGMKN